MVAVPVPDSIFSARAQALPAVFFPQYDVPPRYDFDQGMPDPETYPLEDLQACTDEVLRTHGRAACGYFGAAGRSEMVYGFAGLRDSLAEWVNRRDGLKVDRTQVVLANGSAAGLSMVANAILGPGDGAVCEVTTFPYMASYIENTGATLARAAIDEGGMVIEDLERQLQQLETRGLRPKLIYTIPTFHVPTGVLMPLERRRRLLEVAHKWKVVVVEDNCYNELWYDAPTPPTLLSLDTTGMVIQSDSFSKMLAPGLRTGWLVAAPEIAAMVARMRPDLGVSQFTSHVVHAWMGSGRLRAHLEQVRPVYRRKRDIADAALRKHCGTHVKFRTPEGGIFFWLELADGIDLEKVKKIMLGEGVACRPGERFAGDASARGYLRMSFLQVPDSEIERGVSILGRALAMSAER